MCVSVCACALTRCVYSLSWSCPPPFLHVAERFSVKQQGDCSDAGWGWSWLLWLDDGGGGQNKWVKKRGGVRGGDRKEVRAFRVNGLIDLSSPLHLLCLSISPVETTEISE